MEGSRADPTVVEYRLLTTPFPCFAYLAFLYSTGPHVPGGTTLVVWAHCHQLAIKCPTCVPIEQLKEAVPKLRFLLSRCVKLTAKVSHCSPLVQSSGGLFSKSLLGRVHGGYTHGTYRPIFLHPNAILKLQFPLLCLYLSFLACEMDGDDVCPRLASVWVQLKHVVS